MHIAETESPRKILDHALAYATVCGWSIFPAHPTIKKSYKSAARSDGRKWGATRDTAEITADFTRWPDARIGIPTGAMNGIIVIETDTVEGHGVDGAASLRRLEAKYEPLAVTLQAISPSGSIHRYFRHPGGNIKIKGSASELGPGVDVRGDGQMVIGPPSVNADGRQYRWLNALPIAPLPELWLDLVKFKPPTIRERATAAVNAHRLMRTIQQGGGGAYANAALDYELINIGRADVGSRNHVLNKAAFSLGQLVAAGLLNAGEVEQRLFDAAVVWGNPNKDRDVIWHGMQAGMRCPRLIRP